MRTFCMSIVLLAVATAYISEKAMGYNKFLASRDKQPLEVTNQGLSMVEEQQKLEEIDNMLKEFSRELTEGILEISRKFGVSTESELSALEMEDKVQSFLQSEEREKFLNSAKAFFGNLIRNNPWIQKAVQYVKPVAKSLLSSALTPMVVAAEQLTADALQSHTDPKVYSLIVPPITNIWNLFENYLGVNIPDTIFSVNPAERTRLAAPVADNLPPGSPLQSTIGLPAPKNSVVTKKEQAIARNAGQKDAPTAQQQKWHALLTDINQ